MFTISHQKQPSMRCVLPEESALSDGYMYRMCKKLAPGAAQPALVLQELRADFEIAWGSDTLYPRIPVDTATLLEKRDGKLLGVAGYATSTGVASGVTRADAILHALNEIIERDAESQFLLDLCMGRESFQKFELESKDHLYNLYQELLQDSGGAGGLYSLNCLAGYVFAAVYQKPDNEVLIGYGASAVPEIALERAVTELQQMKYAATISPGWEDEGGRPLSYLEKYPGMLQIAEHKFNWPQLKPIKFNDLKTNGDPQVNENLTHLLAAGINPWVREIYASRQEVSGIFVEQVVLPDAECLFALVFGHPVMPVARLRNRENIHYLLTGEV